MSDLECIAIDPHSTPPGAVVIFLHGLGADGHDFEPVARELALPEELAVRFVFPHAPVRPVTINAGMRMRAWYDVLGLEMSREEDEEGIRGSESSVRRLIGRETAAGVPSRRIVLAGFSQGGALSLQTGLRHPEPLAGIIALSTYLPLARALPSEAAAANASTPIFMGHGTYDPLIPVELGELSRKALEAQGYAVEWRTYPMEHSVCAEEIRDMASWLRKVLD